MAINATNLYGRTVTTPRLPTAPGIPTTVSAPTGGGQVMQPLSNTGIVPVDRTQPYAGSAADIQRMTENRVAAMPPSSFAGAGASFVPVDRPVAAIATPAVMATDAGPAVVPTQTPPTFSQRAIDVAQAAHQLAPAIGSAVGLYGQQRYDDRRQAMMDRLQQRLPPDVFARIQQRFNDSQARRDQRFQNSDYGQPTSQPTPATPLTPADRVRQYLATLTPDQIATLQARFPQYANNPAVTGLLGTVG